MKLPRLLTPSRSFSARITWMVMLTVFIIFSVITYAVYRSSRAGILFEAMERYHGLVERTNDQVSNSLGAVEVAVTNNISNVEENLNEPDGMFDVVKRILERNPNIIGSAVAFEPNYYPQKGKQFSPYAYRDGDSILVKQLGTDEYEYHYMDWYQIPKLLDKPYWTEPYYDAGGGEMTMSTYSYPLHDKEGKIYGILTADVSLEWLTENLHQLDSINMNRGIQVNKNSTYFADSPYSFIIGRGATYIVHPQHERIMNETYFSYSQTTPDTIDDHVGYEMLAGKEGFVRFINKDIDSYIFYSPLHKTGWSMGIIVPANDLFLVAHLIGAIIIALMVLGLLIVFGVCQKVLNRVTKPLERFAESVNEISIGHFDVDLPEIKTKDEMRKLHDSFKLMQSSLVSRIEELKSVNEEKGRIEGELRVARAIQMAMLPKVFPPYPDRDDIDIFASLTPAKEVGGDLYDFYIRDEKLFFCIGDVSGKGVPASLIMAISRALFRTVSAHESNPAKIMSTINDVVSGDNASNMFATFFLGVLDLPTGRLRYCNAGHNAPVAIIGDDIHFLNVQSNIPLGIMTGYSYETQTAEMPYLSSIFLYTDGLTEAEDADHHLFGEDQMIETIQQMENISAKELIIRMEQAVANHVLGAEQSDDLTMLDIQYLRKQDEVIMHRHLVIVNKLDEITRLSEFVESVCDEVAVDPSLTMNLNLAIEEAVTNVILYAYPEGMEDRIYIEAVCNPNPRRLKFIISDWGKAFDPTTKDDVDISLGVEDRPIGGLGIHLIRQIMDSVNYERVDGKNILTLRKKL